MPISRERAVTLAALVVVAVAVPTVLAVGGVRDQQAKDATPADVHATATAHHSTVTARQRSTDYDGDGIADAADQCPTRPETNNGYRDGDGCPDVVATTRAS